MIFSKFTELWNHHHNPFLEYFYHPPNVSQAYLQSILFLISSPRQQLIGFLSL